MKKTIIGLMTLAAITFGSLTVAKAAEGWTTYAPGVIKTAIAKEETVLLFYKSAWWGTCAHQDRVLRRLRASQPKYNGITFVHIDWDTFKHRAVTTSRNIPRRSTMVLIKNGKETNRLVAETNTNKIKELLDKAIPK